MRPENDPKLHDEITEAGRLTEDFSVPAEGEFSLEEILAEYGGGTRQKLLLELEDSAPEGGTPRQPEEPAPEKAVPEKPAPRFEPTDSKAEEEPRSDAEVALRAELDRQAREALLKEAEQKELPRAPRPISMGELVGRTVDSVMDEQQETLLEKPHRRGLFSRRRMEDTEELYAAPQPEESPAEEPEEQIGPEPDPDEQTQYWKKRWRAQGRPMPAAFLLSLLLPALLVAEYFGKTVPFWSTVTAVRCGVSAAVLIAVSILARDVFARGFGSLRERRLRGELLSSLLALACLGDCAAALLLPGRTAATGYAAVACFALTFAMRGGAYASRGKYDAFRTAAVSEPPYLVTDTDHGACKQIGTLRGFYTDVVGKDLSANWQAALMPVILMATVVFAGLSSLGQGRGQDFLLDWSALLAAAASFALPLSYALPWARLSRRLQKDGCTVAGWPGAERISRKNSLILTDADLFPPGTIGLNGIKMFGEELSQAASYAASLARASGSGLERLFDSLLREEGGSYEPVDDFSFYEEGGFSGTIHGESAILGTASFMRKMEVRLPGGLNLRTGIFLAVDRQLTAVFAVKYKPSENVDWALRLLRRGRILPILASRDPNITPELLRRKFNRGVKVEYPSLSARVALSEQEGGRGRPRALLYREGLLPYAEAVAGSRRLRRAVCRGTGIALLGSVCGTLLAFYLTFQGAFTLLSPLFVLLFQLLWLLPTALLSDWVGRF